MAKMRAENELAKFFLAAKPGKSNSVAETGSSGSTATPKDGAGFR